MARQLDILQVAPKERKELMELLLLADESESIIERYIREGEMFKILFNHKLIGVVHFVFHHRKNSVELKNMALLPSYQGKGIGREVIERMVSHYADEAYDKMIVGTANSSIGNIIFYQKAGFRIAEVRKNFFEDYPKPIVEQGIRALDMLVFERFL